jgi:hypothetical protein
MKLWIIDYEIFFFEYGSIYYTGLKKEQKRGISDGMVWK